MTYPYHQFAPDCYEGRYYNSNGYAVAVVAVVNPEAGDWSAYIGGCAPRSEKDGCLWVAERGAKLSKTDAQYYFPEIKEVYRP